MSNQLEMRNAHYNAFGTIDCELNHPVHGWIPFTADPNDGEEFGRLVHQALLDGAAGEIAPYVAPPEPEPLPFAERQAALIRQVDLLAKEKRNSIVADISPAEMASWPIKRAEAMAYQASGLESDAPNLAVEAEARETTLADLVAKMLAKAAQLSYIEAQIAGYAGKLQDQINAAEDEQALEAIDITAGWPA